MHLCVLSWEVPSLCSSSKPPLVENPLRLASPIPQISPAVLSRALLFAVLCLAFIIHLTVAYLRHNLRAVAAPGEETICSPHYGGDRTSIRRGWFRIGS